MDLPPFIYQFNAVPAYHHRSQRIGKITYCRPSVVRFTSMRAAWPYRSTPAPLAAEEIFRRYPSALPHLELIEMARYGVSRVFAGFKPFLPNLDSARVIGNFGLEKAAQNKSAFIRPGDETAGETGAVYPFRCAGHCCWTGTASTATGLALSPPGERSIAAIAS